jgi:hypothetical protein
MRTCLSIVAAAVVAVPAVAGLPSSAVIDDFGAGGAGLGFTRTPFGGASVAGGVGIMPSGGGFQYLNLDGFNASSYTGISLKVTGDLGAGTQLTLNMSGAFGSSFAANVPLNGALSGGYIWITFDQIDAISLNDPGFLASSMAAGEGLVGIGLSYSGSGSITVDDFEFGLAPVPAPGAFALLGAAGLAGSRRRR